MEQVLRQGIAACVAAAVAGAGLIAVAPAAPPALPVQHIDVQLSADVFSALSQNVQDIVTDLGNSVTAFTHLHLSADAAALFSAGYNAIFMPQNVIIAGIAALTGDTNPLFLDHGLLGLGPDVLGTVWGYLQVVMNDISVGVQSLFALHASDAFGDFSSAFDAAVIGIPAEVVVGSMMDLGL